MLKAKFIIEDGSRSSKVAKMAGLPYGLISRRLTALFHHCQPLSAIVRETGWPGVSDLAGDGFGEIDHGFLGWHGWDSSSKLFAFIRVIREIRGPMVWRFCDGPPSLFHAIVASGVLVGFGVEKSNLIRLNPS